MTLAPGVRLGPYEVVGALGAGGMGEVYRATDTSLDRRRAGERHRVDPEGRAGPVARGPAGPAAPARAAGADSPRQGPRRPLADGARPGARAARAGRGRHRSRRGGGDDARAGPRPGPGRLASRLVQRFPELGGRVQSSTAGGTSPLWCSNGTELFYRQGRAMMTVAVDGSGAAFRAGQPERLFEGRYLDDQTRNYVVAPDGRFLMINAQADPRGGRLAGGPAPVPRAELTRAPCRLSPRPVS